MTTVITKPSVNVPGLINGSVRNLIGPPLVQHKSLSASSLAFRTLDPITISAGLLLRGDNASASLYGFAQEPSARTEPAQMATMPFDTDVSGRKVLGVYVADEKNEFMAQVKYGLTLAKSMEGVACDLAPALVAPTPVITQGGTAGSTTRAYKVGAFNLLGECKAAASSTSTTTGNATLSTTNYDILTIPQTQGATWYRVYLGGSQYVDVVANPSGTTVVNVTSSTVDTSITPPTANYSGWVIDTATISTAVAMVTSLVDAEGTVSAYNTPARVMFKVASGKSQFV